MRDQVLGDTPIPNGSTIVMIQPTRRVVISLAAQVTGLTVKAINQKIDTGEWREGHEWHKAPDGRRYVDLDGYNAWVAKGKKAA